VKITALTYRIVLILGVMLSGAGCATSSAPPSGTHPVVIDYRGEKRIVSYDALDALNAGDEVLLRNSAGQYSVAIIASRRGPGVYRLRNLELKFLSADNYAGRLLNTAALAREALAKRAFDAGVPAILATAAEPEQIVTVVPVTVSKVAGDSTATVSSPPVVPTPRFVAEDLMKLEDLRKRDVLNDIEFQAARKRLLGEVR
jgi:hypothetical protein